MSNYAYIHFNETIRTTDCATNGRFVNLNREHPAGTTDLVSARDYDMFMEHFSDRVTGKKISGESLADVSSLIYDQLKKEAKKLSLTGNDKSWFDVKCESLESMKNSDGRLDPKLCGGPEDIASKVMGLQEGIRKIQGRGAATKSKAK